MGFERDHSRGSAAKGTVVPGILAPSSLAPSGKVAGGRRRAFPWLALATYGAALGVRHEGGRGLSTWALAAMALVLAAGTARSATPARRRTLGGLSLVVAALVAEPSYAVGDALATGGVSLALIGALTALLAIAAPGGLLEAPPVPKAPWHLALAVPLLLATGAAFLRGLDGVIWLPHALHVEGPPPSWVFAPAVVGPAAGAFVVAIAAAYHLARRRLELGTGARLGTSLGALFVALVAAVTMVATDLLPVTRAVPLAAAAVALATVMFAEDADPVSLAQRGRRFVVLGLTAGAVAIVGAMVADQRPQGMVALVVLASLVAFRGAVALEAPLRPERGAFLDALAAAQRALRRSDLEEGVREALRVLREGAGPDAPPSELWTLAPSRVLTVDGAGYGQEREASLPEDLVPLAAGEPEAVLRREVVEALLLRRPELRPLAGWFEDHGALAAVVVTQGGAPEGLLVVPRGDREEALTLEEARGLKGLADVLGGVCAVRASLARSLQREHDEGARADALEDQALKLRHQATLAEGRHAHAAARLAASASVGPYSPAARLAESALRRRLEATGPVLVVAPSGVDPAPHVARAHGLQPGSRGPLVLVEGTAAAEHDLDPWRSPTTSPLALAEGGVLVLLDAGALPQAVQHLVGRALSERRVPWERPDPLQVQLVATSAVPFTELAAAQRLDPLFEARLGDLADVVTLPRLAERGEDLRAVLLDRVAREGLRVRGTPVGIEPNALPRLVDHPFPGEDAELAALVQRLVAVARGSAITADDVEAILESPPKAGPTSPSEPQ